MKHNSTEIRIFANSCASGLTYMHNAIGTSESIQISNIGKELINNYDESSELLTLVSKEFAKVTFDTIPFDIEIGEVQNFQCLIEQIINCCNENNWFKENTNEF